ncbi:MAG: phosphoribosylanthranilate isomerase [Acidobacteriota bacterium]|nr:phosphoribosylanthranilate isomerase [Acidobacteriota bacterium]
MTPTEVKICGLTRPEDVALACELGARWLGFNFAAESPRRVGLNRARELALASLASPGTGRVGVFVRESLDEIRSAVAAASLDAVQVHRPLRAQDVEEIPRPVFAVVHVAGAPLDVPAAGSLERCRAVFFDSAAGSADGGTGRAFDWSLLEGRRWPVPFFLAGGLTPENVGAAVARLRPAGVDVASGVESAPGIKDRERMVRFFEAVKEADENKE